MSNNIFHLQNNGGIDGCGNCTWYNNLTYGSGANDSILHPSGTTISGVFCQNW
ncbi:MAG: hypothetical protein IPK99_01590 [Flavobacteriales bacterium]|nr:hypothetical protein [Flavobacteriales bacterium]